MAYRRDYDICIDGETRRQSGETATDALREGLERYAGDKRAVYATVSSCRDVLHPATMIHAGHYRRTGTAWERFDP